MVIDKVTSIGQLGSEFTIVDGVVHVTVGEYSLPIATDVVLGGIKIGSGVSIDGSGVVSIPVASATVLGLVKIGTGISITDGVISATGTPTAIIQRSIGGVVSKDDIPMYWVAPVACIITVSQVSLGSAPSATGTYFKLQVMKNGTLGTNSIFTNDVPMQITELTSPINGIYTVTGVLDSGQITLAAGDVIHFRVDQADAVCTDMLIQLKVAFT